MDSLLFPAEDVVFDEDEFWVEGEEGLEDGEEVGEGRWAATCVF